MKPKFSIIVGFRNRDAQRVKNRLNSFVTRINQSPKIIS